VTPSASRESIFNDISASAYISDENAGKD